MVLHVDIKRKLPGFTLRACFDADEERLGVLGPSGSGKSMTLRCIAGIEQPDEGVIVLGERVLFDSKSKINIPPQKRNIGYLFQNYALFPHMTVAQNIGICLVNQKDKRGDAKRIVEEQIEFFQLSGLENRYPSQLSGGQQQRVALARILAHQPDVLLLDEPFSALDSYLKWQIEPQLIELLDQYKGTTLMVSHNRDEIYRMCGKIAILNDGKVEAFGQKKALFEQPQTVAGAQLTGCKNISAAQKLDDHTFKAIDWGIALTSQEEVPDGITHVGLRAHYLYAAQPGDVNALQARVVSLSETLFSVTVMLVNTQCKGCIPIRWEVDKTQYNEELIKKEPFWLGFSKEKFLFLK